LDVLEAQRLAEELITAELAKMNQMWLGVDQRTDVDNGELFCAGVAQLDAVFDRRNGEPAAFDSPPEIYPEDWSGFRSYGADVPNIVVGIAFLTQEIVRLLVNGEDYTRLARRPDQTFNPETGLPQTNEA
jgi:hypothetical protein